MQQEQEKDKEMGDNMNNDGDKGKNLQYTYFISQTAIVKCMSARAVLGSNIVRAGLYCTECKSTCNTEKDALSHLNISKVERERNMFCPGV